MDIRRIVPEDIPQGINERLVYSCSTTRYGSSPTSPVITVLDTTDFSPLDVTTIVMPVGSPTIAGDVITLPRLENLTLGRLYRVNVRFTSGGQVFEPYFVVVCEL